MNTKIAEKCPRAKRETIAMKMWTVRLGLSLMIIVGFWTNPLPAQEILVVPAIPYEPAYQPPGNNPFAPRPPAPKATHLPVRLLNSHGVACQNDPYYPTCGNVFYELRFAFGSCRSFFDQACVPGQLCHTGQRPR